MGIPIFLSSGGRTKRIEWSGKSFEDLAKLYFQVFSLDKDAVTDKIRRGHFYLKHQKFEVFFEGFELREIVAGSVVQVRGPHALDDGPESWEVDTDATGMALSLESDEEGETDTDNDDNHSTDAEHQGLVIETTDVSGSLTIRQLIWRTLDDPEYSGIAKAITILIMLVILFSTSTFVVNTLPMYQMDGEEHGSVWHIIEACCIAFFTIELLLRLICVPPSLLSLRPLNLKFFGDVMNIIDILAILPFYIELGLSSASIPGLAVLRVIRLVRIFRLFRVSKTSATIFAITMKKSAKPLYMLIFFTSLALIIFSSLMYYAERGTFDPALGVWKRLIEYECQLAVDVLQPPEADVDRDSYFNASQGWLEDLPYNELLGSRCRLDDRAGNATAGSQNFFCMYAYRYKYEGTGVALYEGVDVYYKTRKANCMEFYEISPFESIPSTMWWCLVTMTTVGYGDIYPVMWYGRALGMVVMLSGILVIALPITVIGSNFSDVYRQKLRSKDQAKQAARSFK